MSRKYAPALAPLIAVGMLLASASPAAASRGSVPLEVTTYLTSGLVDQLVDLYGQSAAGTGIDFDESTVATNPTRVFAFTPELLDGEVDDHPVRRLNEWVALVLVDDRVVGVATVVIAEGRDTPELSLFERTPQLAAAVQGLGADAALVRDDARGAWYALTGEELTAITPGNGVFERTLPLDEFASIISAPVPEIEETFEIEPGVLASGGTLLIGLAVITLLLILARRRPAKSAKTTEVEDDGLQSP